MESAVAASIGTPEHLIVVARQGRLPKEVLVRFLAIGKRPEYLAACGAIEKRYTEAEFLDLVAYLSSLKETPAP